MLGRARQAVFILAYNQHSFKKANMSNHVRLSSVIVTYPAKQSVKFGFEIYADGTDYYETGWAELVMGDIELLTEVVLVCSDDKVTDLLDYVLDGPLGRKSREPKPGMYINDSYYEYEQVAGAIRQARDWVADGSDQEFKLLQARFIGNMRMCDDTAVTEAQAAMLEDVDDGSHRFGIRPYDPTWTEVNNGRAIGPAYNVQVHPERSVSVWKVLS